MLRQPPSCARRVRPIRGDELSLARLRRDELEAPLLGASDYLRRSHRLLEEGRLEEAARIAENGVVTEPSNVALLFNLGLALAQIDGQVDRAIDVLSLAIKGDPEIVETATFLRATLLERKGRREDALASLDAVFGDLPANEDALLMRARILKGLGRNGPAEDLLRSAMGAGRRRVAIELAALMLREGRYREAQGIAEQGMASA
jgi:tetratricopeptide (TPR) repeat protein